MLATLRTRIAWTAVGLGLGIGLLTSVGGTPVGDRSVPEPAASAKAEAAERKDARDEAKEAKAKDARPRTKDGRKLNHGYYVSRAAHCEDVSDPENDVSFEAPSNCETDGAAKGEYVSSVAGSRAGKK